MLRSLITLVIVFAITVTGFINPAYAESNDPNFNFNNSGVAININGNDNLVTIDNSFKRDNYSNKQDLSDPFIKGLIVGTLEAAGTVIGGATVCYIIDGVATVFYPPAATLAGFCPAMGGTLGGGNAANQLFKAAAKAM